MTEEQQQLEYFKGRALEQITEPADCSFIKDYGTGYLIKLTGGMIRLKSKDGDDITISEGNLFEMLKNGFKDWQK